MISTKCIKESGSSSVDASKNLHHKRQIEKECISCDIMKRAIDNWEGLLQIYELLSDNNSKKQFEWFVKYRLLYALIGEEASRYYPFPITKEYIRNIRNKFELKNYDAETFTVSGWKIKSKIELIYDTWGFRQYIYNEQCKPVIGDVVISGGAYYGETSIWFSEMVGDRGRIYAFEPMAESYMGLVENIKINNIKNIVPINAPLWSDLEDISFRYNDYGSNFHTSENESSNSMRSTTIDQFVCKNTLDRVDFIKLDVEGSEFKVLTGAENTIKKFKPKLAISVYHRAEDFVEIPLLIKRIMPEYKLFFSHKCMKWGETLVFAMM